MARGDFTLFQEFLVSIGEKKINLETDTIKLAIIDGLSGGGTVDPAAGDTDPQWGAGSGVDYDTNEVTNAGGYTTGGLTLSGPELERSGATATFDDDDSNLSLAQNGSGFTNGYWGILYSDTASNKECIGFLDLGGPVSEQAGAININWHTSGILTISIP